jgi:apolipoprotein N-acyltransferase
VYQTSDSTFQQSWAPAQHASLGAVRAAETGRPVVQAALTGDTVAFDARGRLLARMTASQRGVTVVRLGLPPAGTRTPYDRVGDVVPWVAAGIALIAAARWIVRVRRSRPGQVPFEGNPPGGKSVSVVGAQPGDAPRPEPPGEDAPPPEGAAG